MGRVSHIKKLTMDENHVEKIKNMYINGDHLKRSERIYHENEVGVRMVGIPYLYNVDELAEYSKCYNDVFYFIDRYCNFSLHSYQREIIENLQENRFSITMHSMETGVRSMNLLFLLHQVLFEKDHSVLIIDHASEESESTRRIIGTIYKDLPFFLKKGVTSWTGTRIDFENGSNISFGLFNRTLFGRTYDTIWMNNMGKYAEVVIQKLFKNVMPTMLAMRNSRVMINSVPMGYNYFYDLFLRSENEYTSFKANRVYWTDVPNRGDEWKNMKIEEYGEEYFENYYELRFKVPQGMRVDL